MKEENKNTISVEENAAFISKTSSDNSKSSKKDFKSVLSGFFAKAKQIITNKRFICVFALLILISAGSYFFVARPLLATINSAKVLKNEAQAAKYALSQKNIPLLKDKINSSKLALSETNSNFQKLNWTRSIPFVKNYYADGEHLFAAGMAGLEAGEIFIAAIEPYKDFLGLGETEKTAEDTAEDRIQFLVETINEVNSHLDEVEEKLDTVNINLQEIDPKRYPKDFRGIKLQEMIIEGKTAIAQADEFLSQGRPLIQKADWLLGKDEPRTFLFLFQNDGEIRPTGGFWTAYGLLKVDNGEVTPIVSDDIYKLDAQLGNTVPAPRPIKNYLDNVSYWHLRDMNLSPDFSNSIETFMEHYSKIRNDEIDGIFALDTQVLVDLIDVLGGIGVPGWGNFISEPDDRCWGCPQVIYQLEMIADKPQSGIIENRKGFLAPLMHSIIANAMGSPKEKIAALVQAGMKNLDEKHILVYFPDDALQNSISTLGYGGRIVEHEDDYIHINDTNFGGAKSNLFIDYNVKQEYIREQDKLIKKVTVEYTNTAPPSNCNLEAGELCLNGIYRNWFRIYVPQGSKLIKMTGSEIEPLVYEELGKTVFEGFYGDSNPLYPKSKLQISVEYELPFNKNAFSLTIQKQPGKDSVNHSFYFNGELFDEEEITTDSQKTISF
jgi:hypothetical protein